MKEVINHSGLQSMGLNGKLASLNKFLTKSAERSLPFFKTLKKYTKKGDFQWTTELEAAFKQMKKLIVELPILTTPMEKEELIVYLAAAREAVSAVLMTKREAKQMPIYFVSRALQGRLQKWSIELEEYDIQYKLRISVKGKILTDFIVERPEDDSLAAPMEVEEELSDPWILFTYGSSCIDGSGAGLILTSPDRTEFTYALRFEFDATNNEAKYEALIAGLRIAEQMGIKKLQTHIDSRLVDNQVNGYYIAKEPGEIISDNGKQFRDNPFKDWCEKMNIHQHFASVKHPQINGLVERANRSLGEGIKARLDKGSKDWMEEVSYVLWEHYTMIKSSNEDTPFSLTYGTEAVIPAKIGMPTLRTTKIHMVQNDEALKLNLDLLEEKREQAAI
ncbi:reverse transcriptase domain-containing protein [Tanacetum coccineum]